MPITTTSQPTSNPMTHETLPRLIDELLPYTVVDLFSGAGGMTCGFWQTGFQLRGAVDRQVGKPGEGVPCNETYRLNYGISPLDEDLQVLDPHLLRQKLGLQVGELTVLISCPPCTGYSQKRFQNMREDDDRNELVLRTADFVEAFAPEFLVMENVPEMVRGNFSHHFEGLYTRLKDLGYSVWVDILDFATLGLPQRRRRALVIARRGNGPLPDIPSRTNEGTAYTVREALADHPLPPLEHDLVDRNDPVHGVPAIGKRDQRVLGRCQLIRRHGFRWATIELSTLTPDERGLLTKRIVGSLMKGDRKTYPDCYGTMFPDKPSPTLIRQCGDIGTGPWFHWEEDRMLSAREMSILQGFPFEPGKNTKPFYRFAGPITRIYQQIGNAVPPLISRIIAEEIISLLQGTSQGLSPSDVPPLEQVRSRDQNRKRHTR